MSLYLNGKLLETKKVSRETQFKAVFTVNYTPGTLRAEAGGKSVTLSTAGEPAKLRLTTDRKTIKSGGQDLAFITVEVLDKAGNVCPEAAIPCNVTVTGGATLMAAASADLKDTEPYTSPRVTTWKGRAIIVIRSGNKAGTAKVSVKGGKLAGMASVKVE